DNQLVWIVLIFSELLNGFDDLILVIQQQIDVDLGELRRESLGNTKLVHFHRQVKNLVAQHDVGHRRLHQSQRFSCTGQADPGTDLAGKQAATCEGVVDGLESRCE